MVASWMALQLALRCGVGGGGGREFERCACRAALQSAGLLRTCPCRCQRGSRTPAWPAAWCRALPQRQGGGGGRAVFARGAARLRGAKAMLCGLLGPGRRGAAPRPPPPGPGVPWSPRDDAGARHLSLPRAVATWWTCLGPAPRPRGKSRIEGRPPPCCCCCRCCCCCCAMPRGLRVPGAWSNARRAAASLLSLSVSTAAVQWPPARTSCSTHPCLRLGNLARGRPARTQDAAVGAAGAGPLQPPERDLCAGGWRSAWRFVLHRRHWPSGVPAAAAAVQVRLQGRNTTRAALVIAPALPTSGPDGHASEAGRGARVCHAGPTRRFIGGDKIPEFWGKPSNYTEGTAFLGTPTDHLDVRHRVALPTPLPSQPQPMLMVATARRGAALACLRS